MQGPRALLRPEAVVGRVASKYSRRVLEKLARGLNLGATLTMNDDGVELQN